MSVSGIHGLPLEVTVVGCYNLEDKEWVSRQDPYVCLEYGSAKFRTKTCTDGGKNPTFQEKFIFTLIEGLWELNVVVWNNNTLVADDHIGSGRIQLHKVLSQGFEDCAWPLQSKTGRHSGEVRVIMHYPNAKQPQNWKTKGAPSFPEYAAYALFGQVSPYAHPPAAPTPYPTPMPHAAPLSSYNSYPPSTTTYPPAPYAGYPPQAPPASYAYPPQVYPPPPQHPQVYPPAPAGIYLPPPY
ncbi:hypothetical protein like AT4G34150 [Hibiscus trionum]|uniref:C2 domain-containing protein n=1 Tax=Hibiscus trionum TaxID=183268 RepID=A0A9W7HSA7_HIBTR|nr:hypothetical protein like AT4G34150 [Hibiscus trionum]